MPPEQTSPCEDFALCMLSGPKREDFNVYFQTNWASGAAHYCWLWSIYTGGRCIRSGSKKTIEEALEASGKALLEVRRG